MFYLWLIISMVVAIFGGLLSLAGINSQEEGGLARIAIGLTLLTIGICGFINTANDWHFIF